ncbi:hypothetical protein MATL_G00151760 [Megalops atlanticus]|uniref:ATP synthase peripheral stalk subunit F6, mitochondrial n=1 Tax=Megalops atlanticus TaxID=7932 RepID=A0A9D3PT31_MEGAT|nr:hypothetical protein MATL_G00151760 [Megalops atlanticus]
MAASFLRIGRVCSLKCLQLESWSSLRRVPAAALCTKSVEPERPARKTSLQKAKGKTSFDIAQFLQRRTYADVPKKESDAKAAAEPAAAAVADAGAAVAETATPVSEAAAAEPVIVAAAAAEAAEPAEAAASVADPAVPVAEAVVAAEAAPAVTPEVAEPVVAVSSEELVDQAPVVAEAAGEELQAPAEAVESPEAQLDPIQKLFLDMIREYSSKSKATGGLVDAGPEYQKTLSEEMTKLQRLYGGGDLTKFPEFNFPEPKLEEAAQK